MSLTKRQKAIDRTGSPRPGKPDPAFIKELLEVEFSVTKLARARGLSLRQFERKFNAQFQRCPREAAQEIRMTLACERLLSDAPLKRIAAELGYNDAANFSNAFQFYHGVSPSRMRLKLLNLAPRV